MPYLNLKSVVHGNSAACIEQIFQLHFPEVSVVADITYGRGRFWKWQGGTQPYTLPPHIVRLDANTTGGAEVQSDYRYVPLKDQSVDVGVFDPPFIFSAGLRGIVGAKRFFLGSPGETKQRFYGGPGSDLRVIAPRNALDLRRQTVGAMVEMRRVARQGMILKGQDLIVGTHPNWWSYQVMHDAYTLFGIWPEDMLIQVSPAARLADPRWKQQLHFRRAHAIYLIFKWDGRWISEERYEHPS